VPLPEYSYDVPCDESYTKIVERYDANSVDGEYVRGELEYTTTTTVYYSWTGVENPAAAVIYTCDQLSTTTPPVPPSGYAEATQEIVREDPVPEPDCYIGHGAQASGNSIYTRCTTVTESVYNKSNSEYDPAVHIDRTSEYGSETIRITGTKVTE